MNSTLSYALFFIVATVLCTSVSSAAPMYTTYQAKIIKPDGNPLEATSVNFQFTILDPTGICVLYTENFNSINMNDTGGLVYFSLGSGIKTYPTSGSVNFSDVFNNQVSSLSCKVGGPASYTPSANDLRKIVMQFHDGTGWQTLPAMNINHVPYAMYAKNAAIATTAANSLQLNGKTDLAFVQVTSIPTCSASQALQFNGATFGCIAVESGGAGGGLLSVSGTAPIMVTGSASAPVISISVASMSSDGYLTSLDYTEFKAKLSASATQIINTLGYVPVSSSTVASQISLSNLSGDVSGTINSNFVQSVGGKTASQISTSVNDTLAATSSNTASTIIKRDSSGNATLNDIYANAAKINYVDIYKPGTSFNIRLQAPTSLIANYSLVFPQNAGIGGQVLATDGSGNLSWTSQTTTITSSDVITALGYTPQASGVISSQWNTSGTTINYMNGNVGLGTTTPVTKLDVSGGVRIGLESTTCAPALAGTLRYNASNVEYCNGTSWQAFGVSGSGITNINGSTSGTQSLATGTGGTAPNIATANGVHTFNIPNASTGSVTGGLISNADYTTFTNKITSSAASIAQVLGYVPADNAASGTYAQKANNLSDLTNIATARTNLGLGTFATANTLDLGSASATGTLAITRLPNFTGDATIAAASNTIILSNSGVTAGTYTKVTVDSKGRVTSSAALASSDVTTALGYAPVSASAATQWTTSGSTIYYNTGNIGIGTATPGAMLEIAGQVKITGGAPGAGKILISDASGLATWETPAAGNSGTVISVTSANGYLSIINTTSAPVITANIGTVSNTLAAGNDARFTDSRSPTGNAGGDLSGTYPNPIVAKINGNAVASTTPVTGQVMRWTGSQYAPVNFSIGHLLSATGTQQFANSACLASQTLTWSSLTDTFTCANIAGLDAGVITTGTINAARLPAQPFVIGGTFVGILANSQVLTQFPFPINVTIPANCTNSRFEFLTAATASTTISLQKCIGTGFTSCTQFGTATISASGKVASFTCVSATSFTAGTDSLVVLGPATADATAATAGWAIYGTR